MTALTKVTLLALVAAELSANTLLARDNAKYSDHAIRTALVGSWVVATESVDRTSENAKAQQIFRSDGTYTTLVFADKQCGVVIRAIHLKWIVENGILISAMSNGRIMEDEIIGISKQKITLRDVNTGAVFIRQRSLNCS